MTKLHLLCLPGVILQGEQNVCSFVGDEAEVLQQVSSFQR